MTRRRALGMFFVVLGLAAAGIGLVSAIGELAGLYRNALEHPMDDPANGGEQGVSKRMLSSAVTGGIGAVILAVGVRLAWPRRRR